MTQIEQPSGANFRMTIQDVFNIANQGIVVTGCIDCGVIHKGDEVSIYGSEILPAKKFIVGEIQKLRKILNEAGKGETIGLLFKNAEQTDFQGGEILIN